ncbi:MAG: oligosaccharide flippase family protein [Arenibacterium sp.]
MTFRRSLGWSFSQQIGVFGLQTINMVVIARLLSPEEVGVFIVAFSIAMLLQNLRELGLTSYLIHEPDLTDGKISSVFGLSLLMGVVVAAGLFASRNILETFMGIDGLAQVISIICLVALVFPIEHTSQALIRREMRFKVLHHVSLSAKLAGVLSSIGLAIAGFSYMALVWGMLIEAVMRAVLLCFAENRHLRLGPGFGEWRHVIGFGGWASGASMSNMVSEMAPNIILGGVMGAGATALYDRGARIPMMVRQSIFMPIGRVVMPAFAQDLRAGFHIGTKIEKLVALNTVLVWPAFLVLFFIAEEFVTIVFGEDWIEVASLLPYLLLAHAISSLLPPPDQIMVPYGKVKELFVYRVIQAAFTLPTIYIAATQGLEPFLLALVGTMALSVLMFWAATSQMMQVRTWTLLQIHAKSFAIALFTASPVAVAQFRLPDSGPWTLIGSIILGAVLWAFAVSAFRHPLAGEVRRFISNRSLNKTA